MLNRKKEEATFNQINEALGTQIQELRIKIQELEPPEVTVEIPAKAEARTREIKARIEAETAKAAKEQIDEALFCGMNDYLTKPYEKKAILADKLASYIIKFLMPRTFISSIGSSI